MKKACLLLLALVLLAGVLVGCTPKAEESKASAKDTSTSSAESVASNKVFVSSSWVKSVVDGTQPQSKKTVIVQVGWGEPSSDYKKAHIPGALWLNTDNIEEDTYWNIRTPKEITNVMSDYGITKDTPVIVYGTDSGAARFAFICVWAGVKEVHLLDGGWKAWQTADYPTQKGVTKAKAGADFGATIPVHPEYLLSMPKEVQEKQKSDPNFKLVSIRTWDEFIGKTSGYDYIDRKGEPKGAVWGHDELDMYKKDGTIKPISEIQKEYWDEWGITKDKDVAFYCGTGWRASVPWLLCYENGWKNIQLYDGGWFVWQMDKNNPVQIGDPRK